MNQLYFPYKTIKMLQEDTSISYGERILQYVSGMMYEEEVISYRTNGISNPPKATFFTVDIDNEIRPDLGKLIDKKEFIQDVGTGSMEKQFYYSGILNIMNEEVKEKFLPVICDYTPPMSKPSDTSYFKEEYYRTRLISHLSEAKYFSDINFTYMKNVSVPTNTSNVEEVDTEFDENESGIIGILGSLNTTESNFNYTVEEKNVNCLTKGGIERLNIMVNRFLRSNKSVTLEETFWIYRLKDFYEVDYNESNMKNEVLSYYNSDLNGFTSYKNGNQVTPENNFYGICLLTDCRNIEVW